MYRYSIIVIVAVIIAGCKNAVVDTNSSNQNPFSALPHDSVVVPQSPIKSRIFFYPGETITTTARAVSMTFYTEQIYTSSGYTIIANSMMTGDQIDIQLDSIEAPEGGLAIDVPAEVSFQLGNLPNNLYTLTIGINGQKIKALLLVSDTSYITEVQPNTMIVCSRPRLLRVPKTVIWGQAESMTPFIQQQFIDSLKILGATTPSLLIGNYVVFTVISPDSFYISSALGMRYGQFFLYQFSPDTSVSRALVKDFAKRYGDSVYVELFGGRGEMYYTTVLRSEP